MIQCGSFEESNFHAGNHFYHLAERQNVNFTLAAFLVMFILHGVCFMDNPNSKHGPVIKLINA